MSVDTVVSSRRRPLAMLALGFSAGLPTVLLFDVLSLWLRDVGVSLQAIGLFSLVGLAYSLKFLWAPLVDRVRVPVLGDRLGRRRAWMLACQLPIAIGLWFISATDPSRDLSLIALLVLVVALLSATQDLAIDAWRIEVAAEGGGQGIMAAAYQWGYRVAMLAGGAIPLMLAGPFGWNVSYFAMAALMGIGVAATLAAPREMTAAPPPARQTGLRAAFAEPIRDFLSRHGSRVALVLTLVCVYRIPDLVRSVMGPFYLDLGFTLVEIAEIRRVLGIAMTMVGVAAGGIAVTKLGIARSMVAGAVFSAVTSLGFVWMAVSGRDIPALIVTTAFEHAAGGFAGICLMAYMSTLTSPAFAATQYALLSSIFTLPGRLLASQSGLIVEQSARASAGDGPLSALRTLFTALPAESYAMAADPVALGSGYFLFFCYSSALALMAFGFAVRESRSSRGA